MTGTFVATLDNFIVFVAIPSIRSDIGASFAEADFVVAVYTLTFAIGLITSGRLGDKFGRRRMFLIGLAAFTFASGLCGIAGSPDELIFFRIAQGFASSLLQPQVFALIRVTFTDVRERTTAFAWMGVVIGVGAVVGQVIGGFIISADVWGLSWRPVFLINLPVGIFSLIVAPFVLQESRASGIQRLDLIGAVLSALGLGLLLYPLIEGRVAGWPKWSLAMLATSVVVLGLFAIHQYRKTRRGTSPLLNTDLFRDRTFTVGVILVLLFFATISPLMLSFTYLVQIGFGRSPVSAAVDLSPLALTFAIASFVAGRLTQSGARKVLMMGAVTVAVGAASAYGISAKENAGPASHGLILSRSSIFCRKRS